MTVDAYALKEKPASWAGLIISILVLLATLVYLAFIIYQFLTASPVQKADIYWTIGSGPFPAPIFCVALDGCYISNAVSVAFATSVALKIDPPQQSCIFLPYKSIIIINITYSTSPLDGLSVIWNASNVDPSVPVGFGAQVDSETNCVTPGSPSCNGGIFMMKTPIGPGFNLLTYVETLNYTATGKYSNGQNRKEWFVGKFSNEVTPIPGSTPCLTAYPFLANSASFVQSTLRQNTLYTVQTISKDSLFLVIFGTVGGAYSLFIQIGALLLIIVTFLMSMHVRNSIRVASDDSHLRAESSKGDFLQEGSKGDFLWGASDSSNGSVSSTRPLTQIGGGGAGDIIKAPSSTRPQSRLKSNSSENGSPTRPPPPIAEKEKSYGGYGQSLNS